MSQEVPQPGSRSPAEVEETLLSYVEDCYSADEGLDASHVRQMLSSASGPLTWSCRTEDNIPLLHLAAMVEASRPQDMREVLKDLLAAGADPMIKDGDGDTAVDVVMSLTEDDDDDDRSSPEKLTHMAAVSTLLSSSSTVIDRPMILSVCSWLRKHMPRSAAKELEQANAEVTFNMADEILLVLTTRADKEEVMSIWCSEELLEYLELCAYDKKRGVEAERVAQYLARGAKPGHMQNGATCLLLVVLNPYSIYKELEKVFRLMISAEPGVVMVRDGFKLSPMQWAADYTNVAQQHRLARPNAAIFLALLPVVLASLPLDADAGPLSGLACLKVSADSSNGFSPKKVKQPRFLEGDRVVCCVEAPGVQYEWEEGVIVALWYREGCWPREFVGAPYEVLLDLGNRVYAPADDDRLIRREGNPRPQRTAATQPPSSVATPAPAAAGYEVPASAAAPVAVLTAKAAAAKGKAVAGPRFIRRQREDGKWEMLDTVSGRARPVASDSDED